MLAFPFPSKKLHRFPVRRCCRQSPWFLYDGVLGVPSAEADDTTIDMKPQQEPSTQEVLAGLVERVTFDNDDNGFCVLRIKARGHRDLITVVGHAATISSGEWVTASGEWINDHTHGQQFKARFMPVKANHAKGHSRMTLRER